ncbi:MAG: NAD(P)H-dependent oxidoreductase [Clostridium sp.]|nr:NAD(P)H-dependent oxidoreductase [Clostridium sp.]
MDRNEVINILNFRHACKEFNSEKKISNENLEVILEGGRLAPSSVGIEPWHFVVIGNKKLRDELSKVCFGGTKQIQSCSDFIVLLTRTPHEIKSDSHYIEYLLKDVQNLSDEHYNMMKGFLKNVDNMFDSDKAFQTYATEQTYIALSSMMLTAAMLEIDSCPIGGMDKKAVTKILVDEGLLDTNKFQVTLGCAFGYRLKPATPKKRQPLNEVSTIVR